jgi:hypothetical protein
MDDAVKITVIATGFQPENEPRVERHDMRHEVRQDTPPPVIQPRELYVAPAPEPEPEPEPMANDEEIASAVFDQDDLDTPAYLRQGKLLN